MANTKSARKAARVIARRTQVNKARRTGMRGAVRKVEEAIKSGDRKAAETRLEGRGAAYDARGSERRHAQEDGEQKNLPLEPSGRETRQVKPVFIRNFFRKPGLAPGLRFYFRFPASFVCHKGERGKLIPPVSNNAGACRGHGAARETGRGLSRKATQIFEQKNCRR